MHNLGEKYSFFLMHVTSVHCPYSMFINLESSIIWMVIHIVQD